jgi:hypothetical protein
MAGGTLAAEVACMVCLDDHVLTPANRVYEGHETDHYRCEKGHEFGLDWPDPASAPQWPPPTDILEGLQSPAGSEQPSRRSEQPVKFHETNRARYPYEAVVAGTKWTVRINEFPEEPSLYSLIIDGEVVEELMEWPAAWNKLVRGPDTPRRPVDPDDPLDRYEFEREVDHAERMARIAREKRTKQ